MSRQFAERDDLLLSHLLVGGEHGIALDPMANALDTLP